MANYYGKVLSNYFQLTDKGKKGGEMIQNLLRHTAVSDGELEFEYDLNTGTCILYGDCSIIGWVDYEVDDVEGLDYDTDDYGDFDRFCEEVQKILDKDSYVQIMEIGHERFRYFVARVDIIFKDKVETLDLHQWSIETIEKYRDSKK